MSTGSSRYLREVNKPPGERLRRLTVVAAPWYNELTLGRRNMYNPPMFREDRMDHLAALMRSHPLATLVTLGSEALIATHLPLIFEPIQNSLGILHGHVARANAQWHDLNPKVEALAIFKGPDVYISPSWYPSKRQTGRVVPTWNYAVVHAYGRVESYSEYGRLRRHLESLTALHEARFTSPWSLSDAPESFIESMAKTIVGVDIRITRLEGKVKVSQNRTAEDRSGVVQALLGRDDADSKAIAQLVCEHAPK